MTFGRMELAGPIKVPYYQHCQKRFSTKFELSCLKADQDTHVNMQKTKLNFRSSEIAFWFLDFYSKLAITF